MSIFGPGWQGHPELLFERWAETVGEDDVVLVPGDISWAMKFEEARLDLEDIAALPGKKLLLRGNHDYWWPAIGKLRAALPEGMVALQNDAVRFGPVAVAGSRGWLSPGWGEFTAQDEAIYLRELERLKLSLAAAKRLGGERLIVMLHYPPTNPRLEPSGFTALIEAARPDAVVYGHLHGADAARLLPAVKGVPLHLVAGDALGFKPKLVLDTGAQTRPETKQP